MPFRAYQKMSLFESADLAVDGRARNRLIPAVDARPPKDHQYSSKRRHLISGLTVRSATVIGKRSGIPNKRKSRMCRANPVVVVLVVRHITVEAGNAIGNGFS